MSLVGAGGRILDAQTTSAEGVAVISVRGDGPYQVKVLAPGFAAETAAVSKGEVTVSLRLAIGAETVVVSATRTADFCRVRWLIRQDNAEDCLRCSCEEGNRTTTR